MENRDDATKIPGLLGDEFNRYFLDQYGEPFVEFEINGVNQVWPVKSKVFRRYLADFFVRRYGKIKTNQITNAMLESEAYASRSQTKIPLYVRAAVHNGDYWYDLADDNWKALRITPEGWEITKPPLLFRRFSHMRSIQIAEGGLRQDFDQLFSLINLSTENDRLLLQVYTIACLFAGFPKPIVIFSGAQGSAKSTGQKIIRSLIDPSQILLLSVPTDKREFVQQMSHHYQPLYDNCHQLSQWQSDMFCRASTGEGFSKRELYTDDDDVIYKYQRCPALNGINIPATSPDLLDRAILISLDRISQDKRKQEVEILKRTDDLCPKALYYALEIAVKALQIKGGLDIKNLPRMADFAVFGEAISRALGYPENAFLRAYQINQQLQVETAVSGSLLGDLLLTIIEQRTEGFDGTPAELFSLMKTTAELKQIDLKGAEFPKAPNALTRKLKVLQTPFAEMGYQLSFYRGKDRRITFSKISAQSPKLTLYDIEKNDDASECGNIQTDANNKADVKIPVVNAEIDDFDDISGKVKEATENVVETKD